MTSASSPRAAFLFWLAILLSSVCANAGTFKNPALIDTAYDPLGVASADFNHDGKLDLVYIDGNGSPMLHILLGKGDGTFDHGQDIALSTGLCGYANCVINVADVTADGNLDILLGGGGTSAAQIAVYPGKGDGTFQSPVVTTLPSNGNYPLLTSQMGIGDVNGDGIMDIVAGDSANAALYVLLGNNTGKFTLKQTVTIYFTARPRVYLYDLNGDSKLDIVAIDPPPGGVAHVLLGNGDGTFQQSVDYDDLPMFLADMDGDGHPDLVCVQYSQSGGYTVAVASGNSDGTFGAPSQIAIPPANAYLAFVADYNGDGLPDLLYSTPFGLSVMPSQGNLTYAAPISTVAGSSSDPFQLSPVLAPEDFNNDGHNDLAMGVDGGILILMGNGTGGFASADYYDVGYTAGAVAIGDFDGNGTPDIAVAVAASYPALLLGSGSGTFTLGPDQNQGYTLPTAPANLATADFNGDGKPDLFSTQYATGSYPNGATTVWFNGGQDTFLGPMAFGNGPALQADVNNDGRTDLVFMGNNGAITVMLGQANSTFTTVTTQQWQGAYEVAAIGDLNNDGKPDLLLYEGWALRVWLGNGDGTFSVSNLVAVPQPGTYGVFTGQHVAVADMDGDGKADIVIAPIANYYGINGPLLILYGNGDGTFPSVQLMPVSHTYTQFVISDINRDNKPDLILTDGSGIAVITNLGGRTFSAEDHYVAGQGISGLAAQDVNGDGFPDIVVANSNGTTITLLLNQPNGKPLDGVASAGTFTVTPSPSNYSQPVTLKIVLSAQPGGVTPTGSVTFYVDGTYIADVSLSSGSASHVYATALTAGTHTFVAAYNGDNTYSAESFAVLQTVNPAVYVTQTALTATPQTILTSQTLRLTATVTSSVAVPAGWVTFMDGSNSLGAQRVTSNGVALLDTATLSAGMHQLSAIYQGFQDPNQQATYQPSTSPAVSVTVNAIATTTAISQSSSSLTAGAVITFAATVTAGSLTPFGGASFYDGNQLLGTTSTTAGTATFSTASLSAGSHSITAVFNANATYAASTSPVLNITISAASANLAPSFVVTSLQDISDSSSTLKAYVTRTGNTAIRSVVFLDNGTILGKVTPDNSGTAVLISPSLLPGTHRLTASSSGNSQVAPAVSPEFVEQWPASGPGFSVVLSADSMSVSTTHSDVISVSVTPIGSFQQSVSLACSSGIPSGYICTFSPSVVVGSGSSQLTLQPSGKHLSRALKEKWIVAMLLGLFAVFVTHNREQRVRIALAVSVGISLLLAGCGNSIQRVGPSQSQVLSIQATSGSGAGQIIHSSQVLVTILAGQ